MSRCGFFTYEADDLGGWMRGDTQFGAGSKFQFFVYLDFENLGLDKQIHKIDWTGLCMLVFVLSSAQEEQDTDCTNGHLQAIFNISNCL